MNVCSMGQIWRLSLLNCLVLLLGGCGESGSVEYKKGTVSGKVTHKGESVKAGTISFMHETDGVMAAAALGSDGSYTLNGTDGSGVRVGKYLISIHPPSKSSNVNLEVPDESLSSGNANPNEPEPESDSSGIPSKYQDHQKSGLTFEVKEGTGTFNVDMTD